MRANSLTNLGVGLDYNVNSDYDKVLVISNIAKQIEELAPYADQIGHIVANLPDILTVQQAVDLLTNLTVKATTLETGEEATAELVGTEIRLGLPRGPKGDNGFNGLTPEIEFYVDSNGNLLYDVVHWLDINTGTVIVPNKQEW